MKGSLHQTREQARHPELHEPAPVHLLGVDAHAEEGEDEEAADDADPAVVQHNAVARDGNDLAPGGAVDGAPGEGVAGDGEVLVEDEELQRQEGEDEDRGHDEESQEAVLGRVRGFEELGELVAVTVETEDEEDLSFFFC